METQVKVVVIGHHSRSLQAQELAGMIGHRATVMIDNASHGAAWNHRRAIEWASNQDCRVIIVEDDAVLMPGFIDSATTWMLRFPDDLLSFYLGTGRPPQYQHMIAEKLISSDRIREDYIVLPRLIHGVCYSIPKCSIQKVLSAWDASKPADYAVGDAYSNDVIYPCYSLVDHTDRDSVEAHPDGQPRTERRRAWRLSQ